MSDSDEHSNEDLDERVSRIEAKLDQQEKLLIEAVNMLHVLTEREPDEPHTSPVEVDSPWSELLTQDSPDQSNDAPVLEVIELLYHEDGEQPSKEMVLDRCEERGLSRSKATHEFEKHYKRGEIYLLNGGGVGTI